MVRGVVANLWSLPKFVFGLSAGLGIKPGPVANNDSGQISGSYLCLIRGRRARRFNESGALLLRQGALGPSPYLVVS